MMYPDFKAACLARSKCLVNGSSGYFPSGSMMNLCPVQASREFQGAHGDCSQAMLCVEVAWLLRKQHLLNTFSVPCVIPGVHDLLCPVRD